MDILIVIGQLSTGGTEKHLLQTLPRLRRAGFQIAVFPFRGDGELVGPMQAAGIEVLTPTSEVRGVFGLLSTASRLFKILKHRRPHLVHFFLPEAYLLGGVCGLWFPHIRKVMSRRSLNSYQNRRKYARPIERFLHRRMDHILANSQAIADELCDEGVGGDRITVIHNGIEVLDDDASGGSLDDIRASVGATAEETIIVIVANLIPYKGHADLIEALGQFDREHPKSWRLLVVGNDSANIQASLESRAEVLGFDKKIVWLGRQENPQKFLRLADVGVSASHEEGSSNALLEYMGAGLAVVATAVGGSPEAVIDDESGILVPARNPGRMAAAIERLYRDPALRERLGRAAATRVREVYSLDACVESYRAFYRQFLPATVAEAVADQD